LAQQSGFLSEGRRTVLGEKLGEEQGRVTSRRVLKGDEAGSFVRVEISFEAQGTLLGVQYMNIGTYEIMERGPGQMYGEGQGIIQGTGGENGIWNGHGVGEDAGNGVLKFAASIAFQTTTAAWTKLNGVLVVVEHSINMMDNSAQSTLYEWKG
jgi:hypothetical protein